jgi:N12 class adenine-specific DNA methylase/predicted O-methyltransferase YrrM
MLKRNGQVASRDDQLNLFDFARSREQANLSDSIRINGRTPLAGVSPEDGSRNGSERDIDGSVVRSTGENNRRDGSADEEIGNGAETDSATGPRSRLGDDPRKIRSATSGRESLNAHNYRIRPEDALGRGSLKQKCQDNLAAIELVRRLDAKGREATEDEKRILVRYVGWGGIPQVFAERGAGEWDSERKRLRELLTPEECEFARASTLNAHYTSPVVISAIYGAVQRLGFEHGRVLEPAVGVGHFFGLMPIEMQARSQLTGVEIDPVSARIARKLYPDADIRTQGFENAVLRTDSFDLAISNVPFGDYKVHDPEFTDRNLLIHDYFFAKAIRKVRPGGLIVFVTSKGTLDKANSHFREYLADKVNFAGAIRLPNTAFKQNANTEVTSDIVFLRRLENGEKPTGPAWQNLAEHVNREGETFRINEYFVNRPHMMLGHMANAGTMYRSNEPALVPDGRDLTSALVQAIAELPSGIYRGVENNVTSQAALRQIAAPDDVKENAFTSHDGVIAIRTGATLTPVLNLPDETARRIRGLIKVRTAVREVLRTQLEDLPEEEIIDARRQLNFAYDSFIARFGPINQSANRRAFRGDPDLPLLCSLEDYNPDANRSKKTAIFHERTIAKARRPFAAESPQDALVFSLNEKGSVDLDYIQTLLGRPAEDFLSELKGLIFRNPETEQWETEDQYLSGDVRSKLVKAREAARVAPRYIENVTALESVQPNDLAASEIDARLGAVWIPPSDIEQFAKSLLSADGITVSHAAPLGTWFVRGDVNARSTVANTTEWGTLRYSALELIRDALNLKTPTVYDRDRKNDSLVINAEETEAARDKLEKIKERFKTWVWEDDERRERLCRKYNDEFNSIRLRVFNGSHLTLPSSSQQIALHPHQKNAVWRIVQSDNTLLAHVVGAGKTYTMVAAAIELKRLGLATKPMFVVPNHMLAQFSSELLTLYPTANILAAGKEDFTATNRARLFSRIATGNWDAVIVTHSSFEKIPVSLNTRRNFIAAQIDEIETAIREERADRGTRLVKELERVKKRLTAKLEALSAERKKDNTLTFEELGIDRLFIDEAQRFKNLFYVTKMTRVAGLPQTASERAFDLFLKVQHIQARNQGGGVIFATGTPISNTMAEMFTMQRYLQMETLRRNSLHHFDSWAGTFGETVTSMELSPDGSGYRLQSRFARFVNVPELMQQFRQVADVQTGEMLKLPVPKLEQGRPITISAPSSPELKRFVDQLVKRTEKIKSGRVDPREDNMLKITTEGRKAALDIRLVLQHIRDNPDSKTNKAVEKIHEIWLESARTRGAQLVFCDISTPKSNGQWFSVYDDVRQKLTARGIPADQIAFVQDYNDDASKAMLFKSVREGRVRVLLGSTAKMGEGTNVQTRLVALHHLDAPWRPADIEQREGRILRQGNQNGYVKIFRYVTEGSFDAYMWQTLETKCRFITQVMTGDATMRRAEDVDSTALTYAEVKAIASGNPLVIEKATIDAEVMRLTRLKKQHAESLYQMRYRVRGLNDNGVILEREIANIREDLRTRISTRGDNFAMTVTNETFTDRLKAGRALVFAATAIKPFESTMTIGSIGGFPISIEKFDERATLLIHGKHSYRANVSDSPTGTIASLEHALDSIEDRLRERETSLTQSRRQIADLTNQLDQPFEHEEKLAEATKRQQEIVIALDITKNQASAAVDEGTEHVATIMQQSPSQNKRWANRAIALTR